MSRNEMVHIIDDDSGMRNSLKLVMQSEAIPVQTYDSAEAFIDSGIDSGKTDVPACVVLDIRMRGKSGLDLLKELRAGGNATPVILISGHADVSMAVAGMKLGAIDVLQKPFDPRQLVGMVRESIERHREILQKQLDEAAMRKMFTSLTDREMELLKLVVAGRSNKQIASDLGISVKTVANHRANLMTKTKALNAADLTRMCVVAGFHLG